MSSTKIQKQEIATILELIVEQSETVLAYPDGQIPQIELDIARENIRRLYNNYTILDKINSLIIDRVTHKIVDDLMPLPVVKKEMPAPVVDETAPMEKPMDAKEVIHEEPKQEIIEAVIVPVASVETEEVVAPVVEAVPEPVIPEIVEIQPEPVKMAEPEVVVPEPAVKEMAEPKITPVLAAEVKPIPDPVVEKPVKQAKEQKHSTGSLFDAPAPSVADAYKDNKPSLHEKIGSEKSDNSLASKLQQKPIADLVKSIGINDKFLLIKELFKNNGEEYNEAVQLLNNFSTLMQAFDYLDVLKQKYGWDESSDASLKLYDLIRRKYQQ